MSAPNRQVRGTSQSSRNDGMHPTRSPGGRRRARVRCHRGPLWLSGAREAPAADRGGQGEGAQAGARDRRRAREGCIAAKLSQETCPKVIADDSSAERAWRA